MPFEGSSTRAYQQELSAKMRSHDFRVTGFQENFRSSAQMAFDEEMLISDALNTSANPVVNIFRTLAGLDSNEYYKRDKGLDDFVKSGVLSEDDINETRSNFGNIDYDQLARVAQNKGLETFTDDELFENLRDTLKQRREHASWVFEQSDASGMAGAFAGGLVASSLDPQNIMINLMAAPVRGVQALSRLQAGLAAAKRGTGYSIAVAPATQGQIKSWKDQIDSPYTWGDALLNVGLDVAANGLIDFGAGYVGGIYREAKHAQFQKKKEAGYKVAAKIRFDQKIEAIQVTPLLTYNPGPNLAALLPDGTPSGGGPSNIVYPGLTADIVDVGNLLEYHKNLTTAYQTTIVSDISVATDQELVALAGEGIHPISADELSAYQAAHGDEIGPSSPLQPIEGTAFFHGGFGSVGGLPHPPTFFSSHFNTAHGYVGNKGGVVGQYVILAKNPLKIDKFGIPRKEFMKGLADVVEKAKKIDPHLKVKIEANGSFILYPHPEASAKAGKQDNSTSWIGDLFYISSIRQQYQDMGYDSFVFKDSGAGETTVVFDPANIKLYANNLIVDIDKAGAYTKTNNGPTIRTHDVKAPTKLQGDAHFEIQKEGVFTKISGEKSDKAIDSYAYELGVQVAAWVDDPNKLLSLPEFTIKGLDPAYEDASTSMQATLTTAIIKIEPGYYNSMLGQYKGIAEVQIEFSNDPKGMPNFESYIASMYDPAFYIFARQRHTPDLYVRQGFQRQINNILQKLAKGMNNYLENQSYLDTVFMSSSHELSEDGMAFWNKQIATGTSEFTENKSISGPVKTGDGTYFQEMFSPIFVQDKPQGSYWNKPLKYKKPWSHPDFGKMAQQSNTDYFNNTTKQLILLEKKIEQARLAQQNFPKPVPPDIAPVQVAELTKIVNQKSDYQIEVSQQKIESYKQPSSAVPQFYDVDKLKRIGPQMGYHKGGMFENDAGEKFYVKTAQSLAHAHSEITANAIYRRAGLHVPQIYLAIDEGTPKIVSRWLENVFEIPDVIAKSNIVNNPLDILGVKEGFAIDAWIANWDVVGNNFDNIQMHDGKALRMDPGGALFYKGIGEEKPPDSFGPNVMELVSMRAMDSSAGKIFSKMTDEEVAKSAEKLLKFDDLTIEELVYKNFLMAANFNITKADELIDILKKRRDHILKQTGVTQPKPKAGTEVVAVADSAYIKPNEITLNEGKDLTFTDGDGNPDLVAKTVYESLKNEDTYTGTGILDADGQETFKAGILQGAVDDIQEDISLLQALINCVKLNG